MAADVLQLLDHERRRSITCAALDGPATIGEIASRLGLPDGAIRTVVERLAREQLLVRSERPGRSSGSVTAEYQVAPAYTTQVREVCRRDDTPVLDQDREVLLVSLAGLPAAAGALARERPGVIAWAVRTRDPQLAWMVGLRRDSTPEDRDTLVLSLRDAGADCARLFVGETFSPTALFSYAATVAANAPPALPADT